MKKTLILLSCLLCLNSLYAEKEPLKTTWPEPTILAESWDDLWLAYLHEADKLCYQGDLVAAAEAYKALSENRQYRNEHISALAEQRYLEIIQSNGYIEQKYLENQLHSKQAELLMQQLHEADKLQAQGEYTAAAAIYKELAHAPYPHYWMQNWANLRLKEMRKAGQVQ